jgi:hypothetical protein
MEDTMDERLYYLRVSVKDAPDVNGQQNYTAAQAQAAVTNVMSVGVLHVTDDGRVIAYPSHRVIQIEVVPLERSLPQPTLSPVGVP